MHDEFLRRCLMGAPGAGKSTRAGHARRVLEECLGRGDGGQYQFLASRNTMAAIVGGQAVHSRAGAPIDATHANEKAGTKGADGNLDALFQKAFGRKWMVIDEISTASPSLLGLLDSRHRRACLRRPYARRGQRQRPLVGGINAAFAGDSWRSPLAKQISI